MKKQPILKTNRLLLRPFELTDANAVQRLVGEFEIADTTLNIPHPYEDGMAEQWIVTHQEKFAAMELCCFAIVQKDSKQLIGAIGLTISTEHAHAEMGYWIGKPFWSNGYCTEAAKAIIDYGSTVLNLNRIYAHHFTRNLASGQVLNKLGMLHEGTARQHIKKWSKFEDIELYGIIM